MEFKVRNNKKSISICALENIYRYFKKYSYINLQSWTGVFFIAAVWTRSASVVVHFWMVDQGRAVVFMVLS